jgi:hypothetical protein
MQFHRPGEHLPVIVDPRLSQPCLDLCQFSFEGGVAWVAVQCQWECLCHWIEFGFLRQVPHGHAAGAHHRPARFGIVFPGDELEQRRLPRPVRTDQPNFLVVLDFPGQVAEDRLRSQDERNVVEADGYHLVPRLYQTSAWNLTPLHGAVLPAFIFPPRCEVHCTL